MQIGWRCFPHEARQHLRRAPNGFGWYSQPFKALENFSGTKWAVTKQTNEKQGLSCSGFMFVSWASSLTILCYQHIELLTGPSSTIISSSALSTCCSFAWNVLPAPWLPFTWGTPTFLPPRPKRASVHTSLCIIMHTLSLYIIIFCSFVCFPFQKASSVLRLWKVCLIQFCILHA